MKWFLDFLERHGRKRIIRARDGTIDYMYRYYLVFVPSAKKEDYDDQKNHKPFNAMIHNFRASDDPILHNHPWPWCTIILKGGYWEHLKDGSRNWRAPGSIVFRSADTYHWVELEPGIYPWTLFMHGKRCNKWGFWENGAWVYWKDYVDSRRKPKAVESLPLGDFNQRLRVKPSPPPMQVIRKGGL